MDPLLPRDPLDLGAIAWAPWTWGELVATQHRDPAIVDRQENPPLMIRENMRSGLCRDLLAPVYEQVGRFWSSSVYRSPPLNAAVGGSPSSAHMLGLAADIHFPDVVDAYERIAALQLPALDQLIFEFGRWVHIGGRPAGRRPRQQLLMIFTAGHYEPWNPADERVMALRRAGR